MINPGCVLLSTAAPVTWNRILGLDNAAVNVPLMLVVAVYYAAEN